MLKLKIVAAVSTGKGGSCVSRFKGNFYMTGEGAGSCTIDANKGWKEKLREEE